MLKQYLYTVLFLCWLVLVTFLSLASFSGIEFNEDSWLNIPHLDKLVHVTFYFGITTLGVMFLRERTNGSFYFGKALLSIVFFAILYGIIIEVIQGRYTQDRQGDMLDVVANTIGAIVGAGTIKILFSKKMPLKWKN